MTWRHSRRGRMGVHQIARIIASFPKAALTLTMGGVAADDGGPCPLAELPPLKELLAAMCVVFSQI